MDKKILYIDMDNTLVDFSKRLESIDKRVLEKYEGDYDDIPGIFALTPPVDGAIEAVYDLSHYFEIYVLSTSPWDNPQAWMDKVNWLRLHFGAGKESPVYKRLILSHHKDLNKGHYLIDDRPHKNGADKFEGEVIAFGADGFETWEKVLAYIFAKEKIK